MFSKRLWLILLFVLAATTFGQIDQPSQQEPNREYMRPEQQLEKHLSGKMTDEEALMIFDKTIGCGPLLWEYLQTANKLPMPSGARPINLITSRSISYKGVNKSNKLKIGIFSQRSEILEINKYLNDFVAGKSPKIRKPTEQEMFYVQKTIFLEGMIDLVFTVDFGTDKLIYNFQTENGQKRVTYVDIIGDVLTK